VMLYDQSVAQLSSIVLALVWQDATVFHLLRDSIQSGLITRGHVMHWADRTYI
jgi:hypothetical protein